jgi:UDP-N-acetylmuramoylalanine--D-glutamate ligase
MTLEHNLEGERVTVVGLGIEGIDLVRFLAAEGARVTVSDRRSAEELGEPLAAIEDCDATLSLGENRDADVEDVAAVFVSQGVPPGLPMLKHAREIGTPVSSMTRLFFERCPAPITGVTGSSGKTTTTALLGNMLGADGADYVVGGNIGIGLLSLLANIEASTQVVVELSHTQLESLEVSPHRACVTNVTPNHLDAYSWTAYVALKRRIFEFQSGDDLAVFNIDDEVCAGFAAEAPARVATTSRRHPVEGDGAALVEDRVVRQRGEARVPIVSRGEIALRGDHNVDNVLSAVALAAELGVTDEAMAEAIRAFEGVPHRLEPVDDFAGVRYVNDSIATTPERTLAGIRSYDEPIVLLLGGRDKHLPLGELVEEATRRCRAVIAFGEAGELYASAVREVAGEAIEVRRVEDVAAAVEAAAEVARDGDVVLFSPGGTSFDAYPNFEARGAAFREAVARLSA